jgi:hypothetical protein
MKFTLEIPDERVETIVRGIFDNFPESAMCLECTGWKYKEFIFKFYDAEENKHHTVRLVDALRGFKIFMKLKSEGKLGGVDWVWDGTDFNYDAVACDCIVQCAIFGEVIYG